MSLEVPGLKTMENSITKMSNECTPRPVTPSPILEIKQSSIFNDVLFDETSLKEEQCSDDFGFGIYFEYWDKEMTNSVMPKYKTLREELTRNRYASISEDAYEELWAECQVILDRNSFVAEHIGAANRIYGVKAGMAMTVEHAVCMKVYTDLDSVQRKLKRQCRRLYKDEPLQSVMERNAEIAHWCRLLKECIMFWGETMRPNQVVHSGMNARLMFHSLYQRFECPLSTTTSDVVADQFTNDHSGIRLKLKRASPLTRYFNVAPFSCFGNEEELLFMGSTLQIVNIYIGINSFKVQVAALLMFEQIIKARFIDGDEKARNFLLELLQKVTAISVIDALDERVALRMFLEDEYFDTSAVLDDVDIIAQEECKSNIQAFVDDDGLFAKITDEVQHSNEIMTNTAAMNGKMEYFWMLFLRFVDELMMMKESGTLWMNQSEINKSSMREIKDILFGKDGLIDYEDVQWVKQCEWKIEGLEYESLCNLSPSDFIASQQFEYTNEFIFRFLFYKQHSNELRQCAIFLELVKIPQELDGCSIEVDMKCVGCDGMKETVLFRQWLQPRAMYMDEAAKICGFQCFATKFLKQEMSLKWVFGVKLFDFIWAESRVAESS